MLDHISLHVSDLEKAKAFYTAAFKPLGYVMTKEFPEWKIAGFGTKSKASIWLATTEDVKEKAHIAVIAKDAKSVQAFYKAAIKAGATDNGKPGYRKDYGPGYYAAFVLDADGHNIEAVFHDKTKAKAATKTVAKKKK